MKKKTLNLILLTIAVSIWLYVFYKFIFSEDGEGQPLTDQPVSIQVSSKADSLRVSYNAQELKNPFRTPYNKKSVSKPVKKVIVKKEEIKNPKLILMGIVSDKQGRLAMIQFPDWQVHFVREGDKVGEVKILKITEKKVMYNYMGIKMDLSL